MLLQQQMETPEPGDEELCFPMLEEAAKAHRGGWNVQLLQQQAQSAELLAEAAAKVQELPVDFLSNRSELEGMPEPLLCLSLALAACPRGPGGRGRGADPLQDPRIDEKAAARILCKRRTASGSKYKVKVQEMGAAATAAGILKRPADTQSSPPAGTDTVDSGCSPRAAGLPRSRSMPSAPAAAEQDLLSDPDWLEGGSEEGCAADQLKKRPKQRAHRRQQPAVKRHRSQQQLGSSSASQAGAAPSALAGLLDPACVEPDPAAGQQQQQQQGDAALLGAGGGWSQGVPDCFATLAHDPLPWQPGVGEEDGMFWVSDALDILGVPSLDELLQDEPGMGLAAGEGWGYAEPQGRVWQQQQQQRSAPREHAQGHDSVRSISSARATPAAAAEAAGGSGLAVDLLAVQPTGRSAAAAASVPAVFPADGSAAAAAAAPSPHTAGSLFNTLLTGKTWGQGSTSGLGIAQSGCGTSSSPLLPLPAATTALQQMSASTPSCQLQPLLPPQQPWLPANIPCAGAGLGAGQTHGLLGPGTAAWPASEGSALAAMLQSELEQAAVVGQLQLASQEHSSLPRGATTEFSLAGLSPASPWAAAEHIPPAAAGAGIGTVPVGAVGSAGFMTQVSTPGSGSEGHASDRTILNRLVEALTPIFKSHNSPPLLISPAGGSDSIASTHLASREQSGSAQGAELAFQRHSSLPSRLRQQQMGVQQLLEARQQPSVLQALVHLQQQQQQQLQRPQPPVAQLQLLSQKQQQQQQGCTPIRRPAMHAGTPGLSELLPAGVSCSSLGGGPRLLPAYLDRATANPLSHSAGLAQDARGSSSAVGREPTHSALFAAAKTTAAASRPALQPAARAIRASRFQSVQLAARSLGAGLLPAAATNRHTALTRQEIAGLYAKAAEVVGLSGGHLTSSVRVLLPALAKAATRGHNVRPIFRQLQIALQGADAQHSVQMLSMAAAADQQDTSCMAVYEILAALMSMSHLLKDAEAAQGHTAVQRTLCTALPLAALPTAAAAAAAGIGTAPSCTAEECALAEALAMWVAASAPAAAGPI